MTNYDCFSAQFNMALDMMNRAVSGQPIPRPVGPPAGYTSTPMMPYHRPYLPAPVPPPPPPQLNFKEMLEKRAHEAALTFVPVVNKFRFVVWKIWSLKDFEGATRYFQFFCVYGSWSCQCSFRYESVPTPMHPLTWAYTLVSCYPHVFLGRCKKTLILWTLSLWIPSDIVHWFCRFDIIHWIRRLIPEDPKDRK